MMALFSNRRTRELTEVVAARLATLVATLLVTVVLARLLSKSDLGDWLVVVAAATLARAVLEQGVPFELVRYLARTQSSVSDAVVSSARVLWPGLGASAVVVFALVIANVNLGLTSAPTQWALIAVWSTAVLLLIQRCAAEMARGLDQAAIAARINGFFDRSIVLAVTVMSALGGLSLTLYSLTVVNSLAIAIAVIVGIQMLRGRLTARQGRPTRSDMAVRFTRTDTREVWVSSILVLALAQLGIVAVGLLLDSDEAADIGVAIRLAALVAIPLQMANALLPQRLTRAIRDRDEKITQDLLTSSATASTYLSIGLCIAFIALGPWAIPILFGPDFTNAYGLLLVLLVGQLANVVGGPAGTLLIVVRGDRLVTYAAAASLAFLMISIGPLVIALGAYGAAWSVSLSTVLMNSMLCVFALRRHGFRTDGFHLLSLRTLQAMWIREPVKGQ